MATDTELLQALRKKDQRKAATSTSREPWQEAMDRNTSIPAGSVQAAEVIAGLSGGWGSFIDASMAASFDGSVGSPAPPQVKSNKLGQPGLPEINYVPYNVGTNRFGSKGPSLLGHPIALSIVGATAKSPTATQQWLADDNTGAGPGTGDTLTLDLVDTALSTAGTPVAPKAATIADLYNTVTGDPRLSLSGGLYLAISQSGGAAAAPAPGSGLHDGTIGDSGATGKVGLVPLDLTSKYEIFSVIDVTATAFELDPSKRLADYFTFPAVAKSYACSVMLFEPHLSRLVAVPGSGPALGQEQAFVVVPPDRAATGEYLPVYGGVGVPAGSWTGGTFDPDDAALVGAATEYNGKAQLPIPRPLSVRYGRAQLDSDTIVALGAGRMLIKSVGYAVVAGDAGKILRVYQAARTGTAPYGPVGSAEGANTAEKNFFGWFEVLSVVTGGPNYYIVRRVAEVNPLTGRPFWGGTTALQIDDSGTAGNLALTFTVHDSIGSLHTATYNDPDKVDSARLKNLIDPSWVERSVKTPGSIAGGSGSRPDRSIWNTRPGANPGSFLDLGFRMVLYPAKEGAGAFAGTMVPDYDNPISSRGLTLDPTNTTESQSIDIDYSAGIVTLSHAPVPGAGCDVAPTGLVTSDNPRGEVVLFAACVPYSMEKGQAGSGVRVTTTANNQAVDCALGLKPQQADVYARRVFHPVKALVDGVAQTVASGFSLSLYLDDVYDDFPDTGYLELRVTDQYGLPCFVGPGGEPQGLYGYTSKETHSDSVDLRDITVFKGAFGGGSNGVDTINASTTALVAVLRRDIRTPVTVDGLAGTEYEFDTTYGFSKKTNTLHFDGVGVQYRPDGSLAIVTGGGEIDVLVGELDGLACESSAVHYETLAEAVAYVGSVTTAPADRSWRIVVVAPTNETVTPIVIPADGIIIEGVQNRSLVQWSANTALFDLNGKSDLSFENLTLGYENIGQAVLGTPDRVAFTNSVGTASRIRWINCTFNSGTRGHGFIHIPAGVLQRSLIDHCSVTGTDFGVYTDAGIIAHTTISHCYIGTGGVPQTALDAGGVHLEGTAANNIGNRVLYNELDGFEQGVRFDGDSTIVEGNIFARINEIGIHFTLASNAVVRNNRLDGVHLAAATILAHKVGIYAAGTGDDNLIEGNFVVVSGAVGGTDFGIESLLTGIQVIGNRADDGIWVVDNSIISRNIAVGATLTGDGDSITISDNLGATAWVRGNDNWVQGNTLSLGVASDGSRNQIKANTCNGTQTIVGPGAAIGAKQPSGGISSNVIVSDNVCTAASIDVYSDNCIVTGNRLVAGSILLESNGGLVSANAVALDIDVQAFAGVAADTKQVTVTGNQMGRNILMIGDDMTANGNVSQTGGIGIDGHRPMVEGNRMDGTQAVIGTGAISILKTGATDTLSDNPIINDNLLKGTLTIRAISGIVTGNKTLNTGAYHLNYFGNGGVISGNVVTFNIVLDNKGASVSASNEVSGNHCLDMVLNDSTSINVTGNTIQDDLTGTGVDHTVTGNTIFGDVTLTTCDDLVFGSNHVTGPVTLTGDKIAINGNKCKSTATITGDNLTVTGNKFVGAVTVGGTSSHVAFSGNQLDFSGVALTLTGACDQMVIADNVFAGIYGTITLTSTQKDLVITGNRLPATQALSGISIDGGTLTSTSFDIMVSGNMMGGLDLGGADRVSIVGNNLQDDKSILGSIIGSGDDWLVANNQVLASGGATTTSIVLSGNRLVVTGNIADNVGTNAAGAGAAPAKYIVHGNLLDGDVVFGTTLTAPATNNLDNIT